MEVPERLTWAVETLRVEPTDRLLEIGTGRGVAVSLICERLDCGTITAIDRSEVAIRAAFKRNRNHVTSGKARFRTVAIADADFGDERFDKIFAVNVNVFWIRPARELEAVRRLLSPGGTLFLFYQPPPARGTREIAVRVARSLTDYGFTVIDIVRRDLSTGSAVCVVAGQ